MMVYTWDLQLHHQQCGTPRAQHPLHLFYHQWSLRRERTTHPTYCSRVIFFSTTACQATTLLNSAVKNDPPPSLPSSAPFLEGTSELNLPSPDLPVLYAFICLLSFHFTCLFFTHTRRRAPRLGLKWHGNTRGGCSFALRCICPLNLLVGIRNSRQHIYRIGIHGKRDKGQGVTTKGMDIDLRQ